MQNISQMLRYPNYVQLNNVKRTFGTSKVVLSGHYDVLGITPKATQRDIKEAYYKLSKIYHPDKSNDEESAKKFRDIAEAYEILGNVKLKKMYDKGLFTARSADRMEWRPEPEPTDPNLKFHKSRMHQHAATIRHGRNTPIYNFDAWSQHHYSELFAKTKREQEFTKQQNIKIKCKEEGIKQELLMYSLVGLSALFIFFVSFGTHNYDIDKTSEKKD